ncbi:sulfatase [Rubritalea tangerina]|uniref:Sulfatase n=1 Tax=Rubritalea tangerina TaxID=430798 RepID=A0ABW4ZCL9_9BACT
MLSLRSAFIALFGAFNFSALATEKPNVLFIVVDDLKPYLACYGDPVAITPNFDRLAKQGTLFTKAYSNQAVCGPSRCSTFTSLRPDRTRVHDLKTDFLAESPWVVSLPEHLRNHGYSTAGSGKLFHGGKSDKIMNQRAWHALVDEAQLPFNPNYPKPAKHYQNPKSQAAYQAALANGKKGFFALTKALKDANANPSTECLNIPDDAYIDGAITKQSIQFIHQLSNSSKPFFIAVGFKKPHLAFTAPKKYWDLYDPNSLKLATYQKAPKGAPKYAAHTWGELKAYSDIQADTPVPPNKQRELIHGYYACVSYIDAQIGKLLDTLEAKNLTQNTLIVLWSDHGWHLGDHGLWCKHSNYEQATRSVLMFSGPGVKTNQQIHNPVELIDIFPTVCELTQTPQLPNLDGISLSPSLNDPNHQSRRFAISQYPRHITMGYALRDNNYRYVAWLKNPNPKTPLTQLENIRDEELYKLSSDPLETTNLALHAEQQARITSFRDALNTHLKQQASRPQTLKP